MSDIVADIEDAKECAKKLLGVSEAQIERGLELHRSMVVVDCYGFNPHPYTVAMQQRLQGFVDSGMCYREYEAARIDLFQTAPIHDPEAFEQFKTAWESAGVTCIVQNIGPSRNILQALNSVARFDYKCERLSRFVRKAHNADDILECKREGKHCYIYSLNDVPLLDNWYSGEEDMRPIRDFMRLGVRMMHLTYNRRNRIGDGCTETNPAGLSDFGREVVGFMNRVGVIVDTAHSSWQTTVDAARASSSPMVASHTVCAALRNHVRAKPDEALKAIADTDGLVGICMISYFLREDGGGIVELLDHIEYAVKLIGENHVGVGADTAYVVPPPEGAKVAPPPGRRENWWGNWKPGQIADKNTPIDPNRKRSLTWTNFPFITVGLVARGFSDEAIQKIMGGNFLRVLKAVRDAATGD